MKDTKEALKWITDILQKHDIPFQITGGFAANIYGTKRELADIDIEIPAAAFDDVFAEVRDYIIYGPENYKDENWDLLLMTLKYKGQEVDICDSNPKIFNKLTGEWDETSVDLSKAVLKEVFGIQIPVVPIEDLIKYKKKLGREVDLIDVKEMLETK